MKNFVQNGDTIPLTAPYAVAAGAGALVGQLFGIAVNDVANAVVGEFSLTGVYDITALSTDTPAEGALVYWDNTNKRITTTSAGNSKVGTCVKTKLNGETTCRVRLNGVSVT